MWFYFPPKFTSVVFTIVAISTFVDYIAFCHTFGFAHFLAGSCGLELFNNLALPTHLQGRCAILAYGPTARRMPDTTVEVVVGRRDWISPALCRVPAGITRHGLRKTNGPRRVLISGPGCTSDWVPGGR